jgi:mRNA-degrading endonuclease HigB of HigAB toxin-antitoxin module
MLPSGKPPLTLTRYKLVRVAQWHSTQDVQKAARKAKVLNRERVRFEVAGGNCRLVAAFDFHRQVAFVKRSKPFGVRQRARARRPAIVHCAEERLSPHSNVA